MPPIEQISYDDGSGGYQSPSLAATFLMSTLSAPACARAVRVAEGGAVVDEVRAPDGLGVYACALGGEDGRDSLRGGPGGDNPAGPGPDHDGRGNTRPGGVVPRENGDTRPGGNRPSWRERHAEAIAAAERRSTDIAPPTSRSPGMEDENFVPGADDESLEDSSLYGRAAIERILGGMLIDEHAHGTDQ